MIIILLINTNVCLSPYLKKGRMPTTYSEKKDSNSTAWTVVISQMRY